MMELMGFEPNIFWPSVKRLKAGPAPVEPVHSDFNAIFQPAFYRFGNTGYRSLNDFFLPV